MFNQNYNPQISTFRYGYGSVVTFGGCQEDFMLVVHTPEEDGGQYPPGTHKLLLSMNKLSLN